MNTSLIASKLRSLREGNLDVRLPEDDPEIGEISREFNLLVEEIAERNREVIRICKEIGKESNFGGQIEIASTGGDWDRLVAEVNDASRTLTIQIRTASLVASKRVSGDVETRITLPATGEMKLLFDLIDSIGKEPALSP